MLHGPSHSNATAVTAAALFSAASTAVLRLTDATLGFAQFSDVILKRSSRMCVSTLSCIPDKCSLFLSGSGLFKLLHHPGIKCLLLILLNLMHLLVFGLLLVSKTTHIFAQATILWFKSTFHSSLQLVLLDVNSTNGCRNLGSQFTIHVICARLAGVVTRELARQLFICQFSLGELGLPLPFPS